MLERGVRRRRRRRREDESRERMTGEEIRNKKWGRTRKMTNIQIQRKRADERTRTRGQSFLISTLNRKKKKKNRFCVAHLPT